MKGSQIIGMLGVCLFSFTLSAYQVGEPGIFAFVSKGAEAMCKKKAHRHHHPHNRALAQAYEKKIGGQKSSVLLVNGLAEFNKEVVEASLYKPVVVKVHSIHSGDSQKIRQPFQQTAEKFKNMVSFVSLDLFKQHAGRQENYQLIGKLMASMKVSRIDLPLVLFFRNGNLYSPLHAAGAMLQGFHSRDKLSGIIQEKFFSPRAAAASPARVIMPSSSPVKRLLPKSGHDLSLTTTAGSRLPAGKDRQSIGKKQGNGESSWWNRLKNIFK